jgi:hypothetical protein
MKPVTEFLQRWLAGKAIIVDPFSGNSTWGTITNDLNPDSTAQHHLLATDFLDTLIAGGLQADAVLFDPPYSPRQISEAYKSVGLKVGMEETQNSRLYKNVRDRLDKLLKVNGVALSFGWNSSGFGKTRGYAMDELLLLCHGGAHNDTICLAETKVVLPK